MRGRDYVKIAEQMKKDRDQTLQRIDRDYAIGCLLLVAICPLLFPILFIRD